MTTWTRKAPGHYSDGDTEIRRQQWQSGDACGSTVTLWHIEINGIRWDSAATLTRAKARAERLPTIVAGTHCWARGCDQSATGGTPRAAISLPGDGDIPTCDRCHTSFTGLPRNPNGRRCWSSDCSRPAVGITARSAIYGNAVGYVLTCDGCHRRYTGQAR